MANDIYRFFFSLSSLGPIMVIFALIQLVNNQNIVACIVILSIGISICVLGCVAFCLAIKVIPSEVSSGQISSIEPDTQGTSTFIGAYTLPLLSLFAENNQIVNILMKAFAIT